MSLSKIINNLAACFCLKEIPLVCCCWIEFTAQGTHDC